MFKIGQKVSHYLTTHKVGTIVNIEYLQNNFMTAGGTTQNKVYVSVEYKNGEIVNYQSGDLVKVYD
jgi:hypothetical protein